jgi:GDP-L-fucose synthase
MKILVFGSRGLVGSSTVKILKEKNIYKQIIASSREDTNLFDFSSTYKTISDESPDVIVNAAARVGGIVANNTNRFEFIVENLKINLNILESIKDYKNIRLINLGSSCIYPLNANNPIKEEYIMSGKLEPTNSPYAMAKLTAIEIGNSMKQQFGMNITNLMPTNLYGPNDNFSEIESHVIPGLIRRMHNSKTNNDDEFKIWGTGEPKREFLYAEDLAEAINFVISNEISEEILNVGSNEEVTIKQLAEIIRDNINYEGSLTFDTAKPDGNPRKLLDSTKIFELGWKPKIELEEGIEKTYKWFLDNIA